MKPLHSALFIDYDNVRPELDRYDPAIGARFTNKPLVWLEALEKSMPLPSGVEAEGRRIVSRRCYASPHMINDHRRNFTQTGFEVVDCPPLTRGLKNSADIYIVMEIIDYLQRYPNIEEFIILSGDADFVPVLNRLRKELKKSVIFTSYNTTAAYKNCSDRTIEADFFAEHLAVERVAPRASQGGAVAKPAPRAPEAASAPKPAPAPAPPAPIPPGRELTEAMVDCLRRAAQRSLGRLTFAGAKAALREGLPAQFARSWAGYKSFIALLDQVDLAPLEVDRKHQSISDPDFHVDLSSWHEEEREQLDEFIDDVLHTAAKPIPVLRPTEYSAVFGALAGYYGAGESGTLNDAVSAVVETCRGNGLTVAETEVRFIATGIMMQGFRVEESVEAVQLASLWRAQVFRLCRDADWLREPEDAALLAYWCHADGEDIEEARDDFLRRTGGDAEGEDLPPMA